MVYNKRSGFVKGNGDGREKTRKIVESVPRYSDNIGDSYGRRHFRTGVGLISRRRERKIYGIILQ